MNLIELASTTHIHSLSNFKKIEMTLVSLVTRVQSVSTTSSLEY